MFFAFRFFTGMGIGGEYAAINSAIDELIPARVRGTVDLVVNGSYWLGTAVGAAATLVLLDPKVLPVDIGWRVCFFMGAVLGLAILLVRRNLPESPRWLFTHGHADEAESVVDDIEHQVTTSTGERLDEPDDAIEVRPRETIGFLSVAKVVFRTYPRRSILGLSLFVGQAFLYNAVFFTYSLVLTTFYKVSPSSVGDYLIAFAVGNFLGPLILGRLVDIVGRRVMIAGTYLVSGTMLGITACLFDHGVVSATTQTVAWVMIFFFASAGASSAYLTVILGGLRISARLAVTGNYPELVGRLWDASPGGATRQIVEMGAFRPPIDQGPGTAQSARGEAVVSFELPPNDYIVSPGYHLELELVGSTAPFFRSSNGTFSISVSHLRATVPLGAQA